MRMRSSVGAAIVFFATLIAAALLALGIPALVDLLGPNEASVQVAALQPMPFIDVPAVVKPTAAPDGR